MRHDVDTSKVTVPPTCGVVHHRELDHLGSVVTTRLLFRRPRLAEGPDEPGEVRRNGGLCEYMPSVTFGLTVDVSERELDDETTVEEAAREKLHGAPSFDGFGRGAIEQLEVLKTTPDIELQVGDVWYDDEGHRLRFGDHPTDGPLFKSLDEEHEEFEDIQFATPKFQMLVQDGRLKRRETVEASWRECRRSIPPCELDLVPDGALDERCWIEKDGPRSVTLYSLPDGSWSVLKTIGEDMKLAVENVEQDEAEQVARKLRFGDGWLD